MDNETLNNLQNIEKRWEPGTADYFPPRLEGACAILLALCCNIGEFKKEDGRATDEAIILAIQHVLSLTVQSEEFLYGLRAPEQLGELSLQLMQARALLEIIDGMFSANSWDINLGEEVLINYLGSIERILRKASDEVTRIENRRAPAPRADVAPEREIPQPTA